MDLFIICLTALLASALTFFSGFGLGTVLTPVFAIFFPIEIAVALTAVTHFLNNIFKFVLVGRHVNRKIALRFGIPSVFTAFAGAWMLKELGQLPDLLSWSAGSRVFHITPIKLCIGILLLLFSLMELVPKLTKIAFPEKYIPLGGLLSGFFGGLSGNQGALRSAFLLRAGLSKEQFISTGVMIAILIDSSRLIVYAENYFTNVHRTELLPLGGATLSAFAGAFFGNLFLKKITLDLMRIMVGILLLVFALLLSSGVI